MYFNVYNSNENEAYPCLDTIIWKAPNDSKMGRSTNTREELWMVKRQQKKLGILLRKQQNGFNLENCNLHPYLLEGINMENRNVGKWWGVIAQSSRKWICKVWQSKQFEPGIRYPGMKRQRVFVSAKHMKYGIWFWLWYYHRKVTNWVEFSEELPMLGKSIYWL